MRSSRVATVEAVVENMEAAVHEASGGGGGDRDVNGD